MGVCTPRRQRIETETQEIIVVPGSELYMPRGYPENPWYPLPKDYGDLTVGGQKEARIAAVCNQKTPEDFVQAWDLFRRLYLMTTEPGFFYQDFYPSPPFHYEAIYNAGAYSRNIMAAPRGFAKSVIIATELPLMLLLTRRYFKIGMVLATDKMIEERFDTIMRQLTENQAIVDDFGTQRVKRGDGIWSRHFFRTGMGSQMSGFSVTGRKRGARPDFLIMDDPEYDDNPDSETSSIRLREEFETLLFRQLMPMLHKQASIYWLGTIVGSRSFLYHALTEDDQRFKYWNRKIYKSATLDEENPEKITEVLWDGKWDARSLEVKMLEVGRAAFMSEYQNTPGSEDEKVLRIDEIMTEYEIRDLPEVFHPLSADNIVYYNKWNNASKEWEPAEKSCKELFSKMYRILTYDPARGMSAHHDYSSLAILGFDTDNTLWVLDMWMGRAKDSIILNHLYQLGMKWMPKVVGVESVSMQIQLADSVCVFLRERQEGGWVPRVVPVDYRNVANRRSKADRIATLGWRFDKGRIKYPRHLAKRWPFNMLYAQTRDFTYDMALLSHDDAIDSVAMGHYVIHNKGIVGVTQEIPKTLQERMQCGEMNIGGVPIISALNADELDPMTVEFLLDKAYKAGYNSEAGNKVFERKPYHVRHFYYGKRSRNGI